MNQTNLVIPPPTNIQQAAFAMAYNAPVSMRMVMALCEYVCEDDNGGEKAVYARTLSFIRKHNLPKEKMMQWMKISGLNSDYDLIAKLYIPMGERAAFYERWYETQGEENVSTSYTEISE